MADDKVAVEPLGVNDTIVGDDKHHDALDASDPSKTHHNVIENARAAAAKEQQMTLLQGIKLYPKAIAWSVLISTCIVMEGYQISLVNNFYAFPQFNEKYGHQIDDGSYEVSAAWQAGLSNVSVPCSPVEGTR